MSGFSPAQLRPRVQEPLLESVRDGTSRSSLESRQEMYRLFFQNEMNRPVDVFIEPWGEAYTFDLAESLWLIAKNTHPEFYPDVRQGPDGVTIYAQGPNGGVLELWKADQELPHTGFKRDIQFPDLPPGTKLG